MTEPAEPPVYVFEGFELDARRGILSRADGRTIPLPPRALDVLRHFVERPGELLDKQALMDAVWPSTVVEENNLNQAISTLRRLLGEQPGDHRFIRTEPGRGYRFVASVERRGTQANVGIRLPREIGIGERATSSAARLLESRTLGYIGAAMLGALLLVVAQRFEFGEASRTSNTESGNADPVSFRVRSPPNSRFNLAPAMPGPALSHDGRQLAFTAPLDGSQPDSETVVWIQRVGDLEARPLLGTERSLAPFWSPDDQFVGFIAADGHLKRIAASGDGSPQEIAGTEGGGNAAWSADDTIVFGHAVWSRDGLSRVPAAGGEASRVTELDTTRGEYSHRFPRMLPDGERFLYLILSAQNEHEGLYLGSLAEPTLKQHVVSTSSNGELGVGPDGRDYLFYVRGSTLLAQPFDTTRGELYETPSVVARSIEPAPAVRFAPFDVSGRTLVYRPRYLPDTRLLRVSRGGTILETISDASEGYGSPSLSPDGTKLAVSRLDRNADTLDVWWMDLHGGSPERLTRAPIRAEMPRWMPSGSSIVYSLAVDGVWNIYRRSILGGDAEPLVVGPRPIGKYVQDVTSDGSMLVYRGESDALWTLSLLEPGSPLPLLDEIRGVRGARVSPDGRWLAYASNDSGDSQIYVTTFPEPTWRRRVSMAGGAAPQWRGDGLELYYIAPDDTLMAVSIGPGAPIEIGRPEVLFGVKPDPISLESGFAYAPDPSGESFIVAELAGSSEPELIVSVNWSFP